MKEDWEYVKVMVNGNASASGTKKNDEEKFVEVVD